jgi:hypothetical protein
MKTSNTVLTSSMLRKAATLTERIELKRKALAEDEALLASMLNTPITFGNGTPVAKSGTRTMSAETKAKIAAGQARRWANQKNDAPTTGGVTIASVTAPRPAQVVAPLP